MRVNFVIHPDFSHLSDFIRSIPDHSYFSGQVLRDLRNYIDTVRIDDSTTLVVKRFKVPPMLRRLIYTFSWSKARRCYEYALRLGELGVGTPSPVAWVETHIGGLFHTGYYVYVYMPDPLLGVIESYPQPQKQHAIADFARFTANMHERGICHRDYNVGNIFIRETDGKYEFFLVDINRMQFHRRLSRYRCLQEFSRITFSLPFLVEVIEKYAEIRGWDPLKTCSKALFIRSHNLYWRIKKALRPVKRLLFGGKKK